MTHQPFANLGVLVRGVVVRDGMDELAGRHGRFDRFEEADQGRRRIANATNVAAHAIGIVPGVPLANAQAPVPGLGIREAEPEANQAH